MSFNTYTRPPKAAIRAITAIDIIAIAFAFSLKASALSFLAIAFATRPIDFFTRFIRSAVLSNISPAPLNILLKLLMTLDIATNIPALANIENSSVKNFIKLLILFQSIFLIFLTNPENKLDNPDPIFSIAFFILSIIDKDFVVSSSSL